MNKIISPLRPDMRGTTVADLQEGLKLLLDRGVMLRDDEGARRELSAALEREHAIQTYGGATRKLVGLFQDAHHLDVRIGEVDQRTAAALNAALEDLGAFNAPPEIQKRVVAGRVVQEDQTAFKGTVVLFHDGDQSSIRLGEDATNARQQNIGVQHRAQRRHRQRPPRVAATAASISASPSASGTAP